MAKVEVIMKSMKYSLLLCALSACHPGNENTSELDQGAYQANSQSQAFVVNINGGRGGLFQWQRSSQQDSWGRPYPVDIESGIANENLSIEVKTCDPFENQGTLHKCFESSQEDYFGTEDPSNAIVESLMILQDTDLVPQCYKKVNNVLQDFESNRIQNYSLYQNIFREMRESYGLCQGLPREVWPNYSECSFYANALEQYSVYLDQAISLYNDYDVISLYKARYQLGLRLGTDELASIVTDGDESTPVTTADLAPYPISISEYSSLSNCESGIGDINCLLNRKLLEQLGPVGLEEFNIFVSESEQISDLLSSSYNYASNHRAMEIIYAAIQLSDKSNLDPKSWIEANFSSRKNTTIESCVDIANRNFQTRSDVELAVLDKSEILKPRNLKVEKMVSGKSHHCALTDYGRVSCWGSNIFGQLGTGETTSLDLPGDDILIDKKIIDIAAGDYHSCALTNQNDIYCWGRKSLASGSYSRIYSPEILSGLAIGQDITSIEASGNVSCLLTASGEAYCWGDGRNYQLGYDTNFSMPSNQEAPVKVAISEKINSLAIGAFHSCATTQEASVFCWGKNNYGQASSATTSYITLPSKLDLSINFDDVSVGLLHSCGLDRVNGDLYCWGHNGYGQLASSSGQVIRLPPVKVPVSDVTEVFSDFYNSCAISQESAQAVCWGNNFNGQVAINEETKIYEPYPISIEGVNNITISESSICFVDESRSYQCQGLF